MDFNAKPGGHLGRVGLAAILAAGVLLFSSTLAAQEARAPGFFLPVGPSLGGVYDVDGEQFSLLLGGEVSLAYLFGTTWTGAFVDAAYDFGPDAARFAGGLELGWFLFGAEAGYFAEHRAGGWGHGPRVGVLWSMSLIGSALRWSHDLSEGTDRVELTLLLKWPFWLDEERP